MPASLDQSYDDYPRIEDAFQAALDESLNPRGPDSLYEIVGKLGLPPGASVVDLGCGEGRQSIELTKRFGFMLHGVDPVPRHIELANEALRLNPELRTHVRFDLGAAEAIPAVDASVDLIWCREVLYHIVALDKAFAECRRVLRSGGRMLIHHMFATDLLEPKEAERMWGPLEVAPASANPQHVEAAFTAAGFQVEEYDELSSEWGEYAEEKSGAGGRRLVHTARLLRDPERYIAKFGRAAYDIMLGDCLWHVYRMIGKLGARVYVLKIRH
ncbi:MAG: class I SAM-dependent methyltransferase [Dehalococcoidia bacterium]